MDGSILYLHTVEFKRLIPGPIELAWDYLTKNELIKTWFADVTIEPRVGGAVTIHFTKDESCSTTGVRGTVSEFRKPNVVAFSWVPQRPPPDGTRKGADGGSGGVEGLGGLGAGGGGRQGAAAPASHRPADPRAGQSQRRLGFLPAQPGLAHVRQRQDRFHGNLQRAASALCGTHRGPAARGGGVMADGRYRGGNNGAMKLPP